MSKEKFELMFLAGGAMLDVISNRLRRRAATPREAVGVAVHELSLAVDEHRGQLADHGAVRRQIVAIRAELSGSRPSPLLLAAQVAEVESHTGHLPELAAAVDRLSTAVTGYLGH